MTDEQKPRLTALMTEAGPTYIDMAAIVFVSTPFQKPNHEPARAVGLAGGHKVYVLDDEFNRLALKAMIPADAPMLVAVHAAKPPKGSRKTDDAPKARKPRARTPDAPSEP